MKQVEDIVRQVVRPEDLNTIVSNIGVTPDLSALFTPNAGMHTAFVEVGLKEDHKVSSFVYMNAGAPGDCAAAARAAHVLPVGRARRRRAQPGPAGAD